MLLLFSSNIISLNTCQMCNDKMASTDQYTTLLTGYLDFGIPQWSINLKIQRNTLDDIVKAIDVGVESRFDDLVPSAMLAA